MITSNVEPGISVHRVIIEHAGASDGEPVYRLACEEHGIAEVYAVSELSLNLLAHLSESYDPKWGHS